MQGFPNWGPRRLSRGPANKFMKIYSSLTMNWTASDTIAAAIKALTFFLENTSTGVGERALSALTNIIIANETSENAIVTYSWGSAKKRFAKQKVWEPLTLY